MTIHYQGHGVTLHHGDCLDVLRTLPDASVDSVVTDPPYGLGFMGKEWDDLPPGLPFAAECLRVLKPGGHLLAFGGTRTWHRLACAVEDAGFEVRDSIAWMYGSGFPKSLDVSKAIDKRAEVNDETRRRIALVAEVIRTHREARGMERSAVSMAVVGTPSGACWNWEHQQLPSIEMWPAIKSTLGIPDKFDGLIEGDRAQFIAAEREVIGERMTGLGTGRGTVAYIGDSENRDVTAPATDAAREWEGWGTALKPAFEPVVVARKPLIGTVAGNVLEHGTGALNIDGCRIATDEPIPNHHGTNGAAGLTFGARAEYVPGSASPENTHGKGRWPANVVLDESQAEALDQMSGESSSPAPYVQGTKVNGEVYGLGSLNDKAGKVSTHHGDTGGASRFFFVASHDKGDTSALTGKGGRIESCETASTAAESSSPPRQFGDSALGGAVTSEHPDTASQTGSPSTSATPSGSRPSGRPATPTTQNIDAESSPEQQPGERTPTASPASSVGPSAPTVTTTTTTSPSTSAGSAAPATSDTTSQWKALGDTDSAPFKYVAKADATERPRVNGTAHPTVKPLSLMRWLVRLVTPPGGTVLEPFAGSGTTVEACIVEGFDCIAIEKGEEYLPLIMQRIHRRRDPVAAIRQTGDELGLFELDGEGA